MIERYVLFIRALLFRNLVFFGLLIISTNSFSDEIPEYNTGALFASEELQETFSSTPTFRSYLPESVDISGKMPKVGNQGKQGSCVGWAVGYAARTYYKFSSQGKSNTSKNNIVSPAYIYDAIRGDSNNCDSGSYIHDALSLLKVGARSWKDYPYSDKKCRQVLSSQTSKYTNFKIKNWSRISLHSLDQVKGELSRGHPVVVGANIDSSFKKLRGKKVWSSKPSKSSEFNGHAFTLVGYNDRNKQFKFINSWGKKWGDKGYGRISYSTFRDRVKVAYVMRPLIPPPKPIPVEVRPKPILDEIKLKIPKFECSQLYAVNKNGRKVITGFVGKSKDLNDLKKKFGKNYKIEAEHAPFPQCEALLILTRGTKKKEKPELNLLSKQTKAGDILSFNVKTPNFSSYLHLSYFQADGTVVHLYQNSSTNLLTQNPNKKITLGDGSNGGQIFKISSPFGKEMVMAITTKSPLFSKNRPRVETEREFLSALRAATINLEKSENISRFYSANYISLETEE